MTGRVIRTEKSELEQERVALIEEVMGEQEKNERTRGQSALSVNLGAGQY